MTKESLGRSMDNAVKHYGALFKLPPYREVLLLQAFICVSSGLFPVTMLSPVFVGIIDGLFLGFSLFIVGLVFDWLTSRLVLTHDSIYDQRRTSTLSLFCWGLWFIFDFIGTVLGLMFGFSWWIRLHLMGFSSVLILRLIIFHASSPTVPTRLSISSIMQPLACLLPFLILWAKIEPVIMPNMLLFLGALCIVSFVSAYSFLFLLNSIGEKMLEIPSLALFKAFLMNWISGLNIPFEEFLERLGEEQDVVVSLIKFDSTESKVVVAVPSVHPGPFKNIGSSLLPSLLKNALEQNSDCIACVPSGLQSHELDLASQLQNQKVITQVVEATKVKAEELKATRSVKIKQGFVTACCQVFGNTAFLLFTLAPNTTEDLPQELGFFVRKESEKVGFKCCVAVNAHNSIDGLKQINEELDSLKKAAVGCLKRAALLKPLSFQVGASTIIPEGLSLKDGMGGGGITAIVAEVDNQKTAYVTIDGNNMVSGLREKILARLQTMGIDEGEICTTDTHAVSALILGKRGYHPIGEAIDHEKLVGHVEKAVSAALSDLKPAKVTCLNVIVANVKVIGEKRLEALSALIDKVLQRAKKVAGPLFVFTGLVLMLILLLI